MADRLLRGFDSRFVALLLAFAFLLPPAPSRAQVTLPAPPRRVVPSTARKAPAHKPTPALPGGILRGRVTDPAGRPIPKARVTAQGDSYLSATTDPDGQFSIPAVTRPGQYRIGVSAPGYVGITSFNSMAVVSLSNEAQVTRDFTLQPGCTLLARVEDEAGRPLKGIRLTASVPGASRLTLMLESGSGITNTSGTTTLGGIPPSETPYQVTAMTMGGSRSGQPAEVYAPQRLLVKLSDPGTTVTQKIVMTKGIEVRGRALCSDGKPAAGWSVSAKPDWWNTNYLPPLNPIDAQGNFTLKNIMPGKYELSIYIPMGETGGRGFPLSTLDLPPQQGLLELKVPRPSPGSTVSISGKFSIKGKAGAEARDAISIEAYSATGSSEHSFIMGGRDTFRIDNLTPGLYTLRFSSSTIRQKEIQNVKAPATDLVVELEPMVKPKLRGVVLDAATEKPIPHYRARVNKLQTLSGPNYVQRAEWIDVSDPRGRFDLEVVGPGVYQVQAAAEGRAWTWSPSINTDTDSSKTTTIRLGAGVPLRGRVVNEDGQPVAGARITPLAKAGLLQTGLSRLGKAEDCTVLSGKGGEFTLEHLVPGAESLRVMHGDYCSTRTAEFKVGEQGIVDTRVPLRRGGTVVGRVYDEQGRPASGETLSFRNREGYVGDDEEDESLLTRVTTSEQGFFRAEHLPGVLCYVTRVAGARVLQGVGHQAFLASGTTTRTLNIGGPGGLVTGRVLKDGKPQAQASVSVSREGFYYSSLFEARTMTDADGKFSVFGVPPGRRAIHAEIDVERGRFLELKAFDVSPADAAPGGRIDLGDLTIPDARVTITVAREDPASTAALQNIYVVEAMDEDSLYGGMQAGRIEPKTDPNAPTVVSGLRPGRRYLVIGQVDQFITMREPFALAADQKEAQVRLTLPAGRAMLDGFYRFKESLPLVVVREDRRFFARIYPATDFYYNIEGLPPGKYHICVGLPGRMDPLHTMPLEDGLPETVDIGGPDWARRIQELMTFLDVEVFTAGGMPLPGTNAWLERDGRRFTKSYSEEHRHTFFSGPGDYTLKVTREGFVPVECRVTLAARDVEDLVARRDPPLRVMLEKEK